jgi:hypothetical protein
MGLMEDYAAQFLDWKTRARKNIERNIQNPLGLFAALEQDVQQGAAADKSAFDASRSVMPEVREAGIREMNARGQELGGLLGTFAGVGAKTADALKLSKAKAMVKAGADPVDVWKQTGWTDQFPDGKWRFEIDDSTSYMPWNQKESIDGLLEAKRNNGPASFKDVLRHPALTEAYPERLGNVKVSSLPVGAYGMDKGTRAYFNGDNNIYLNDALEVGRAHKPMLHESQHVIQEAENFAKGGSPDSAAQALRDQAKALRKQAKDLFDQSSANDPLNPTKIVKPGLRDKALKLEQQASELDSRATIADFAPMSAYKALAGEAEARLTAFRKDLTPAERAARPPWLEFDVPREQQIVRRLLGG